MSIISGRFRNFNVSQLLPQLQRQIYCCKHSICSVNFTVADSTVADNFAEQRPYLAAKKLSLVFAARNNMQLQKSIDSRGLDATGRFCSYSFVAGIATETNKREFISVRMTSHKHHNNDLNSQQ